MVPGGWRYSTSNVCPIIEAVIRTLFILRGTRGDRAMARTGSWRLRDRPSTSPVCFHDLTRGATQCCHSERRSRLPRNYSPVACRAFGTAPEAGKAGVQCGTADVCSRSTCRHGSCARWDGNTRTQRRLERSTAWASAKPPVGKSMEPRADSPTPAARLPRRQDDAHQSRGHLSGTLCAKPRSIAPRADSMSSHRTCSTRATSAQPKEWQILCRSGDHDQPTPC